MTGLERALVRLTPLFVGRHQVVVHITGEGVYLKYRRTRWSSALFCSWRAAFDLAAKVRAREIREERAQRRRNRRGM